MLHCLQQCSVLVREDLGKRGESPEPLMSVVRSFIYTRLHNVTMTLRRDHDVRPTTERGHRCACIRCA
jgi:hypothetical protein